MVQGQGTTLSTTKAVASSKSQPVLGTLWATQGCRGAPACSALLLKDPDNPRSSENYHLEPHQAVGRQKINELHSGAEHCLKHLAAPWSQGAQVWPVLV